MFTTRPLYSSIRPYWRALMSGMLFGVPVGIIVYPFWPFYDMALLGAASAALVAVAVMTRSRRIRQACAVLCICCLVAIICLSPRCFPMRTVVGGQMFDNVSLAEALRDLTSQRRTRPYWRVCIHGEAVAKRQIHVRIPEKSSLEEALDRLLGESGCEYSWHWVKHNPHLMVPGSLQIDVWDKATGRIDMLRGHIFVSRDSILWPPSELKTEREVPVLGQDAKASVDVRP